MVTPATAPPPWWESILGWDGIDQGADDLETIDSELRLLAAVRWSIREHGGEPSSRQVDELLDERNELTGS
jgi:hypothetical protein